jgi:hypothetical protein
MSGIDAGSAGLLVAEFGEWEVTVRPAGLDVVAAYWCSDDGRHRRCVVATTSAELLVRLRAIRGEEPTAVAGLVPGTPDVIPSATSLRDGITGAEPARK